MVARSKNSDIKPVAVATSWAFVETACVLSQIVIAKIRSLVTM